MMGELARIACAIGLLWTAPACGQDDTPPPEAQAKFEALCAALPEVHDRAAMNMNRARFEWNRLMDDTRPQVSPRHLAEGDAAWVETPELAPARAFDLIEAALARGRVTSPVYPWFVDIPDNAPEPSVSEVLTFEISDEPLACAYHAELVEAFDRSLLTGAELEAIGRDYSDDDPGGAIRMMNYVWAYQFITGRENARKTRDELAHMITGGACLGPKVVARSSLPLRAAGRRERSRDDSTAIRIREIYLGDHIMYRIANIIVVPDSGSSRPLGFNV